MTIACIKAVELVPTNVHQLPEISSLVTTYHQVISRTSTQSLPASTTMVNAPMVDMVYENGRGFAPRKKAAAPAPKQRQPESEVLPTVGRLCASGRVASTVYLKAAGGKTDLVEPYQLDITSVKTNDRLRPSFSLVEENCYRVLLSHGYGDSMASSIWELKINARAFQTDASEIPKVAWNVKASASDIRSIKSGQEDYPEKLAKYKDTVWEDFYSHCLLRAQESKEAILKPLLDNARRHGHQKHGDRQCQAVGCSRALAMINVKRATVGAELVLIFPYQVGVRSARRREFSFWN